MTQTNDDWEKSAGVICPKCHHECFRMIEGQCMNCYRYMVAKRELKEEAKAQRRYYMEELRKGNISLKELRSVERPDSLA